MEYCLNRLDEPVFIAVPKPLLTEFGIHHRFESCDGTSLLSAPHLSVVPDKTYEARLMLAHNGRRAMSAQKSL